MEKQIKQINRKLKRENLHLINLSEIKDGNIFN